MDEVPIPNNNPIVIKPKNPEKKPKKPYKLLDTFKNFIFMFPLAMIISYQLYCLGYKFGEFITFPPTSVSSYIFIGTLLLMLLVIQFLMRSIVYSVVVGVFFLGGIFTAWFGPIYDPIVNNLSSIIQIVESAWTRKSIPFQLIVTGTMTSLFAAIIFIQFLVSLLVKSFFELIFGKSWGDGKWAGYLGAIAIILGIHISFVSYHKYSNDNKEKLIWKYYQQYSPMEKFITRTPGSVTFNDNYLWVNNGSKVKAFSLSDGKNEGELDIKSEVVCKGISKAYRPVITTKDKFLVYDQTLSSVMWELIYPDKYDKSTTENTSSDTVEIKSDNETLIPLTMKFINEGRYMLAFYEYGKLGFYDLENGKEIWCIDVDSHTKVNKLFPDKYLDDISFLTNNKKLIIACQNGFIKSIDIKTGNIDWTYEHSVEKIGGKAHRGFLSKNDDNSFVAAFKTGEIVTISYKDGHIIHKISNEGFIANNAVCCKERKAHFITDEGLYYQVVLDGGNIENRINALPNKADIYPVIQNNEHAVYAHRENIYYVNPEIGYAQLVYTSKNRTFITNPVFVDKTMYIGTQDGWIYCIHYGSGNVKWVGHTDGELMDDSLAITDNKLLVKTKADSVFVFDKNYVQ